jgi:serine/threonine-protein kinase
VAEDPASTASHHRQIVDIPRTVGRYEIVDLIGHGAIGTVYRARDPRIGRYVAIKLLRPEFDTPELRDRFSREAVWAGRLSHPNIVTIYDVGEHEGLPFIAMEYVRGETFIDLLNLRPPLPIQRKVQLVEEVCAGLAHAHEAGIVHRDIKPANLIVGPEGTVKILDFGMAKLGASEITRTGAIVGTFNYMSPEQVKGGLVDSRADIFAVGAVLYELLSHQQAFPGSSPDEVLNRILESVPKPLIEFCPDIDPRLVKIVDRALEKDPNVRFQDVSVLQRELTDIRTMPMAAEQWSGRFRGTAEAASQLAAQAQRVSAERGMTRARAQQQIEEHLNAAARAFDDGDYDAAIEFCKKALILDASEERALSLLDRIHTAIDEQQRLALAETQRKEQDGRLRAEIDAARRRFAKGDHQGALQSLEALDLDSSGLVAGVLEELREAHRQIEERRRLESERVEREQRIRTLAADCRTALRENRLEDASRSLELLRAVGPTAAEVADLEARVSRAHAIARLNEQLEQLLGDFNQSLEHNELPQALELLNTISSLAPTDARLYKARKRYEQAVAALAAQEAAAARFRQAEEKLDEAAACLEAGDLVTGKGLLEQATELAPNHARAAALFERFQEALERQAAAEAAERLKQQIAELIRSATHRLQAAADQTTELVLALREVNQVLALDPENVEASNLKGVVEDSIATHREAARARATITNARARFAIGKHQSAIKLLEDFEPASQAEIVETLAELRGALQQIEEQKRREQERIQKQARLASYLAEAGKARQDRQFAVALEVLSRAAETDPDAPELAAMAEQVRRDQAAAQLDAELTKLLNDLDGRLVAGDLAAAADVLKRATALDDASERVQAARQQVETALAARQAEEAQARELEKAQTAAEDALDHGDVEGAVRLLKVAQELNPQHPRTLQLSDRIEEAAKQHAAAEAAVRLRQTVDELLAGAAGDLRADDENPQSATAAMQKIERALALIPDDPSALELQASVKDVLAKQRDAAIVRAGVRNARIRFANGKHRAALQLLESLDPDSHPIVADTLKELREELGRVLAAEAAAAARGISSPAEDAEATRVILRPSAGPSVRNVEALPSEPVSAGSNGPSTGQTLTVPEVHRRWRWKLAVAVGVLLLAILVALFRPAWLVRSLGPRQAQPVTTPARPPAAPVSRPDPSSGLPAR